MKTYKELLQARADLVAEGKALFDVAAKANRELTAEEASRDDAINAELDTLRASINREDARRAREIEAATGTRPAITNVHDRASDEPWGAKTGHKLGEFFQAVQRHYTGQGTDVRLFAAAQGLNETAGADGGFFVDQDAADMILSKAYATGELLQRVKRVPITSGANGLEINVLDENSRVNGSRFGGVQGYWADEAATLGNIGRPKFRKLELKLRKLYALGYATDELLADAGALETIMVDAFADELRFKTEDAIFRGTGAGQPLGFMNAKALLTIAKEGGQAATTVVRENIDKMWARLFAPTRNNAVWLINQDIEPQLEQLAALVGTAGVPIYLPAGGIADTPNARLKGRPVIVTEYNDTLGNLGDIALVDLSQYMLIEKGGIQNQSSIHVSFNTGETAFRATYRVDGQPTWFDVLTPYKGTNTLAPFVTLAAR